MHAAAALGRQSTSLAQYLALFSRKLESRSRPTQAAKPGRSNVLNRRAKVDNTKRMLRVTRT